MNVIETRNVHQALPEALFRLKHEGFKRASRNGPVRRFRGPVATIYSRPAERVMFWPTRDCNPFFHLVESLWMLGGRNDVEFVAKYVQRMRSFSDNGLTFHGAYGFRWRYHFGFDQLLSIVNALKTNPDDRRQVLGMWDPRVDLGKTGKDFPCNTQINFEIDDGELNMVVVNRSNDIIWGAYGANAVHMSYLHEFMARSIGVPLGRYWQVSTNFHAYLETLAPVADLANVASDTDLPAEMRWAGLCPYNDNLVEPYPLMSVPVTTWLDDLEVFLQNPNAIGFTDPFFKHVAVPMTRAHDILKTGSGVERFEHALVVLDRVKATDWQLAAREWVERRKAKFLRANDDGVEHHG